MSTAEIYRANAQELLQLALRTADPIERGRMISLAARWQMQAADIERGPTAEDFDLDMFADDAPPAASDGTEA